MRRRLRETLRWVAATALLAALSTSLISCRTVVVPSDEPAPFTAGLAAAGATPSSRIRDLKPLGIVPYDAFVLPLTSPDGTRAATHVGAAPSMRTILAANGAVPPEFTAVRLWSISPTGAKGGATITEPAILGRATDDEGALVESPQPDGSRWIGLAPWSMKTGDPLRWLVRDGRVNAFAALGPRGALAWCRRAISDAQFELVIRPRGDSGSEAVVPRAPDESWLLPSFSADGSRLFALVLRAGALDVAMIQLGADGGLDASFNASFGASPSTGVSSESSDAGVVGAARAALELGRAIRREPIGTGCTIETAWQCLAAQQAWPIEPARPPDAYFYFHPQRRRLILWRADARQTTALPAGSLGGAYLDPSSLLLSLPKRTLVQSMSPISDMATSSTPFAAAYQLLPKLYLPRATAVPTMPLLLLGPDRADISVLGVVVGRADADGGAGAVPGAPPGAAESSDTGGEAEKDTDHARGLAPAN